MLGKQLTHRMLAIGLFTCSQLLTLPEVHALAAPQKAFFEALGWNIHSPSENSTSDRMDIQNLQLHISTSTLNSTQKLQKQLQQWADHPQQQKLFQQSYARNIQTLAPQLQEILIWPNDDNTDALGKGWTRWFQRSHSDPSKASWTLKKTLTPAQALQEMLNPRTPIEAGCGVALNAFRHMAYFQSFQNPIAFNNAAQNQIVINNQAFQPSPLFPRFRPDFDGRKLLAKQGPEALIGRSGYLNALFEDVVVGGHRRSVIDEDDYAGENFMIVDISQKAFQELMQFGLGYEIDPDDIAFEIEDLEEMDGLSLRMIQWWELFHKNYQRSGQDAQTALERSKKQKNAQKLLESPFFKETMIWGHPIGTKPLIEWIYELATLNPNTPYGIYFYDYAEQSNLWTRFKAGHGF